MILSWQITLHRNGGRLYGIAPQKSALIRMMDGLFSSSLSSVFC